MRPALVIAPAATLLGDLVQLRAWRRKARPIVVAVNDAGWAYDAPLDHWATLHWNLMPGWLEKRKARRGSSRDLFETWTREASARNRVPPIPSHLLEPWETPTLSTVGTSGFFAVQVALKLEAPKVVLAGLPMMSAPYVEGAGTHHGDWPQGEADTHRPAWEYWHAEGRLEAVRSCGGWTADLLGKPTREWLYG